MKGIDYYYNDKGEIGVLVSYWYGAGWSTWNPEYGIKLALDKRIIDKYLECRKDPIWRKEMCSYLDNEVKSEFNNFLSSIGYDKDIFLGGLIDCELEFVPAGSAIKINEYDGLESLEIGYSEFTVLD